ncbi:esterase-like activity of phytase family protein [Erythrobacter litoralis]|uniref:esterase-like activity of phytase family protein n=1 Tax=Erythrobacter litoralis TaxID=39960 RepID=UPI0024357285|nr:esterase-like activity of phytase family protein [Erythrobacter litoralis]MDG6079475.1 esterase-like activity of phytase family protein [Erythrobacter litoralis]
MAGRAARSAAVPAADALNRRAFQMRRPTRLILLALTALGLAPGTFVRETPPPPDFTSPVTVEKLRVPQLRTGPLLLAGAWVLRSENDHFGGYSALVDRRDGAFLAANDAGRLMRLPRPDRNRAAPTLDKFVDFARVDKVHVDIESLTDDPETGEVWAGLEWAQAIMRFGPQLQKRAEVRPAEMRDWGANSGPESLVRLRDGRFVVIEEDSISAGRHRALLFASDPTRGGKPIPFLFEGADGYRPSDATRLPDGRILVVLRKVHLALPIRFGVRLVTADPADIGAGGLLRSKLLAEIDEPTPTDNYEGATVTVEANGDWAIWLISDDNFFRFQRTLLLKLVWPRGAR